MDTFKSTLAQDLLKPLTPVKIALASLVTLSSITLQVQAVTISTEATTSGNNTGIIETNSQTNPPDTLFSEAYDGEGLADLGLGGDTEPAYALAAQNDTGVGAVAVAGAWAGGTNEFSSLYATSSWSTDYTNTSGGAQDVSYSFQIAPTTLKIADWAGISDLDSVAMKASYDIELTLNGVSIFSSAATLIGGNQGHQLIETGTDLGGTYATYSGTNNVFGYEFDEYFATLDLGTLLVGETLTLGYTLTTTVSAPSYETGGSAAIGDPHNLDTVGGMGGTIDAVPSVQPPPPPPPVPEPSSLLLLAGGLMGLGSLGRRGRS